MYFNNGGAFVWEYECAKIGDPDLISFQWFTCRYETSPEFSGTLIWVQILELRALLEQRRVASDGVMNITHPRSK